ncbi:hypothetical protein RvY_11474 [Ramazzottius varieornatus]|uniref:Uncharacterized protein n=1 Tax=Ramazzottius varieornatus TaxID=947166 RepID=A0A1D1VG89_RAMVA|nr:hypothetical protein RvY_11474 [Ramazzottius varieornatus]
MEHQFVSLWIFASSIRWFRSSAAQTAAITCSRLCTTEYCQESSCCCRRLYRIRSTSLFAKQIFMCVLSFISLLNNRSSVTPTVHSVNRCRFYSRCTLQFERFRNLSSYMHCIVFVFDPLCSDHSLRPDDYLRDWR